MAQSIISFQIRGDRPCCFYFELRFGVDGTGFQSPDIMGHAYDPVRIDPTQIGLDQSLGHEQAIRSGTPGSKISTRRQRSSSAIMTFMVAISC
jgi:hypothetical protein